MGKRKTYAAIADKLTKAIGKHEEAMKSGDKFAKATAEKMLPRLQSKLDRLFEAQEASKLPELAKGGKAYAKGGKLPKYQNGGPTYEEFIASRPDLANFPESTRESAYQKFLTNQGFEAPEIVGAYNPDNFFDTSRGEYPVDTQYTANVAGDTGYAGPDGQLYSNMLPPTTINFPAQTGDPTIDATQTKDTTDPFANYTSSPYANTAGDDVDRRGAGLREGLYGAAVAAPTAYNIIQGLRKPQDLQARDFYNPYEGRALDILEGRKYNIDPQLQANRRGFNAMRSSIAGASGGSAGSFLANIGTAQGRKQAADAQAYGTKQNVENQYAGQLANAYGSFGQQRAATDFRVQDINDRNRAARDRMLGSGLTGVSQLAQQKRYMDNLRSADDVRANTLQGLYGGYGYSTDESGRPTGELYYKDSYTG